jgi:hypothetical protein
LTQELAQREDVLGEVRLLDDGVGPDGAQQLLFGDEPAVPLDEVDQQVERLGGERNGLALAQEQPLGRIEPEGPDAYDRMSRGPLIRSSLRRSSMA